VHSASPVATFLFTDIEGSTRLWERDADAMGRALARHDAIVRATVQDHRGTVVKMTGDGVHAAFADPLDAVNAAVALQRALEETDATGELALSVRCGLNAGVQERRDNDFFGSAVNRAARLMSAAHGGQILLSGTVASLISGRLEDDISLRDMGVVRLRDLTSPEHVFQALHPELRAEFPALRSLEATPNNLPQQVTSFIGREHELAEVRRLLAKTRLLTLVGIGGLGKSRLSLQAAAEVMDACPDGVWLVELAPLTDERLVPQALASVLGVKEETGRPVLEAVLKHLKTSHALIILDNCEHLLHACAEMCRALLQAAPELRILASSRERMAIAGEAAYELPTLSVTALQGRQPVSVLNENAAVRLFMERAQAASPAFELTEKNAPAVASICHRLDGIPLAIELAAARVRALSVDNISARLADRFLLLKGGDRTALPRQRTLSALIDWSYDLLTEQERALFRRLAVFAGGWTLEAAESIAPGSELHSGDVLDALARLVEKSLVVIERGGERYRLLDTVRHYALQKLGDGAEHDAARSTHLAYYCGSCQEASAELVGPDQGSWLARLDLELDNILAAHAWADRAAGGAELGLKLVHAVKRYWLSRGLMGLGLRVTVEALDREGAQGRSLLRCLTLFTAGQLAFFMGRYAEATRYLDESLAIGRELRDEATVAAVLQPLGMAMLGQGDAVKAQAHFEEALLLARAHGDRYQEAGALNALAQVHRLTGNIDAAEPLYSQFLAIAQQLGDRQSVAIGLLNLAMVSIAREAHDEARSMLREVHAISIAIGSRPAGQSMLEVCAGLAASRGEWLLAADLYGAAEAHAAQTGLIRDPADEAFLSPLMEHARSAVTADAFAAHEKNGRTHSYDEAMAIARDWLDRDVVRSRARA